MKGGFFLCTSLMMSCLDDATICLMFWMDVGVCVFWCTDDILDVLTS